MAFIERTHCPVCKGSSAHQLLQMPMDSGLVWDFLTTYYAAAISADVLTGMQYILLQCETCQTIWQKQILDDATLNQLYDEWIDPDQSLIRKQKVSPESRSTLARQCAQIATLFTGTDIHVLDFGMGWGDWLKMAVAYGFHADGIETSERRIAYVREHCLNTVIPQDITLERYHFINAEQVFEHLPLPNETLSSCYQWLKPGGVVRISVPDGTHTARKIAAKKWSIAEATTHPLEHINAFTATSLRRMGKDCGFEVIPPPLKLPMVGANLGQIKSFIGVGIRDMMIRFNIGLRTAVWLRKPDKTAR